MGRPPFRAFQLARQSGTLARVSIPSAFTRWSIIALCAAIFAIGQFHRAAGSIFTPILMDRFTLSATVISGLVAVMFMATVLSQIPWGSALDRFGPRRMLCISISIVAFGTALFALGDSFETLMIARIIIGFGSAVVGAATHVIVAWTFPRREFGYVNGMIIMLGSTGGMMGTYPLAFALARFEWWAVFGTVAMLSLALTLVVLRLIPASSPQQPENQSPDQPSGYLDLLRMAEVRKILTLGMVTFAPMTTITGLWGGPFLQDTMGFSSEATGAILLLLFSGSVVAAFLFGQLDRIVLRRKAMILTAICTSASCLATLAIFPPPGALVTVALLFTVIFCQTFYIPLQAHMRKVVPLELVGRASILLSLVGVAAIPLMQTGFGAILDLTRAMGFETTDQFRFSFGAMAVLMASCALVYTFARQADDEQ